MKIKEGNEYWVERLLLCLCPTNWYRSARLRCCKRQNAPIGGNVPREKGFVPVKWFDRMHMVHRFWRYRLRSERQELAFLLRCPLQGALVADIGANLGIYSYWMHRAVGPMGRVIAFEPQPELQEHLSDLRESFRLNNLEIVPRGLSTKSGTAELIRPCTHWGGASLEEIDNQEETERFQVPLTTLDKYFADRDERLRFIKCDVEGHEEQVFAGGGTILSEDRPILLFECPEELARKGKLFAQLAGLNYEGRFFHNHALHPLSNLARYRSSIDQPYLNYVFATDEDWLQLPMTATRAAA